MKTKKLIELLNEADPTGEIECCVDNHDIYIVERLPAYWDGRLQVLIRDETSPWYNVTGAKITSRGDKIKLRTLSIDEAIWNDPELPVDLSECTDHGRLYAAAVDEYRQVARRGIEEVKEQVKEEGIPTDGEGPVPMKSMWKKAWEWLERKNA
jgi:hypothetical protein